MWQARPGQKGILQPDTATCPKWNAILGLCCENCVFFAEPDVASAEDELELIGTCRSLRFVVGTPLKSFTHTGIFQSDMPPFHTDHESHELINVRIREDSWNFANFLSKSWRSKILLRYRYDRVTNIRGIRLESLKYCPRIHYDLQESITNTAPTLWISYESVKYMPNASTNQVLLKLNSWLFLTIHGSFPQDRYEKALTCFGVYSWDSWQIRSRFVVKPWIHESPNELIIPTNANECLRIYCDD